MRHQEHITCIGVSSEELHFNILSCCIYEKLPETIFSTSFSQMRLGYAAVTDQPRKLSGFICENTFLTQAVS